MMKAITNAYSATASVKANPRMAAARGGVPGNAGDQGAENLPHADTDTAKGDHRNTRANGFRGCNFHFSSSFL